MEVALSKPLAQKRKKHKFGCCTKFLACICCCFVKKGWGIGSDIWNKLKMKLHKRGAKDKIYSVLLDLYSHKPSVEELSKCRISPKYDSTTREDLEFYIPQLCNLLLYGFTDRVSDITTEVLNLCKQSFFFSHRILWFLLSTEFDAVDKPSINPESLIASIMEVSRSYQFIHLGNGEKLHELYKNLKIYHSIDLETPHEEPEEVLICREIIASYNYGSFNPEENDDINPVNIPIAPLIKHQEGYMSTLSFIDILTKISNELLKSSRKTEFLKEELTKLNTILPAGVYIPFNMFKARNCAVLHIPVSEARVFTTKERAPFKISIEIFRPYKEIKSSAAKKKVDIVKEKRSISVPVSTYRDWGNSTSKDFLTKSLESDITDEDIFAVPDNFSRRRNQTFAIARDADFAHYEKIIKDNATGIGSLAVVYGEVDETGNSVSVFKESFKEQAQRIKLKSPYGKLKTWSLLHVIVKSGDDLRQEQLAMQLISFFQQTFDSKKLELWLYPYDILATGVDCGILECVPDAVSLDGLKKALPPDKTTLYDFFLLQFGQRKSKRFKMAKKCFMKSLAGYSLVCFILQIKDRHNGNILIDRNGHLIHIDFGFMLSNSPGGSIGFEQAPFKLTTEFEAILGGRRSKLFQEFRSLCVKGYSALKEKAEQIILMVEMMRTGSASNLGCFIGGEQATTSLRERLLPKTKMSEGDCKEYINDLIDTSLDNWSTKCYDRFQYCCQNIFY